MVKLDACQWYSWSSVHGLASCIAMFFNQLPRFVPADVLTQRWTRAEPPWARASTSASLAMVTSPGNVGNSAP